MRKMRIASLLLALVLTITGVALVWLGGRLILADGSLYYFPTGLCLMSVAWLTWRRSSRAVSVFAALWLVTLVWSLWESGFDGWALAPRLVMFSVIGLWMMTPWVRRSLGMVPQSTLTRGTFAAVSLAAMGGLAWIYWTDRDSGGTDLARLGGAPADPADGEWRHYGRTLGGSRYSPLTQINADNVAALERAWTYRTGLLPKGGTTFQTTPLKIGDRLYFCTGNNDVISLDAESGREIWRFRARANQEGVFLHNCRGVTHYRQPEPGANQPCAERIYTATIDARLLAVDAATGARCTGFGTDGEVDLLKGMGEVEKGYYLVTSPPALVRGRLVVGGWVTDGQHVGEPSGVIRAFDAVTGQFAWAFDIGRPETNGMPAAGESFTRGTPNSWAPMSGDEELGLVYVPTGNATPDYYGAHRTAQDEKYASSVVALDAETGAARWAFQTTHHDLWDYDVASQPVLTNLADGRPVLLQPTKRGQVFMLDRRTGAPVANVEELPVPTDGVDGERYSPTQPFSTGLPGFGGPMPTERTMWGLTPIDQALCRLRFRQARFEGTMTPITERPTITWPGYLGGIDWGSVSIAPDGLMIVNSTHVANYNRLLPRPVADAMGLKPMTAKHGGDPGGPVPQQGTPYGAHVTVFLSPLRIPCQQPPYGFISAVDLNSRNLLWRKRLGTSRDSGPLMISSMLPIPMGLPNLGGSVITGSGLVFIGATQEHMLRAYDIRTGRELWKGRLPAGGQATPMTYWSTRSGRQFVVIAAGGHPAMLSGRSDELIAYALPIGNLNQR